MLEINELECPGYERKLGRAKEREQRREELLRCKYNRDRNNSRPFQRASISGQIPLVSGILKLSLKCYLVMVSSVLDQSCVVLIL